MRTPAPMVGCTFGSTAGPAIAVLVPSRMETRTVSRRTTGTEAPACIAQTLASWLSYPKGSMSQTSAATPANPPMKATSSVAKRITPPAA